MACGHFSDIGLVTAAKKRGFWRLLCGCRGSPPKGGGGGGVGHYVVQMNEHGDVFDYVIVGAGTAGCVLASRLSEDHDKRVALIEAGPMDRHPFIHIPAT